MKGFGGFSKTIEQEERRRKNISNSNRGRRLRPESIIKRTETRRKNGFWKDKKLTAEKKSKTLKISWTKEKREKQSKKMQKYSRRYSEEKKGEKSHLWKGGVYSKNKTIRKQMDFRLWRKAVFERDNYTCQKCNIRNKTGLGRTVELHPHHIFNFSEYESLRFDTDNGITLCKECHNNFHNIFGRKENNLRQIKIFIEMFGQ